MKTKILLLAALLMAAGAVASAQITTGEPTSKVIKTGNRPGYGDFGIYLGMTSDLFRGLGSDVEMKALPLINFKYMSSKHSEWRLGIELYKTSEFEKGNAILEPENFISGEKYETELSKTKNSNSNFLLYPGWAYHFSSKNILDVYAGFELPVGLNSTTVKSSGEDWANSTTKRSLVVGLGAFVGLQAFIADLPLAVGAEFGISSLLDCGMKFKNVVEEENTKATWYSKGLNSDAMYDKLNVRKGEIGSQVRFTVTYYFK